MVIENSVMSQATHGPFAECACAATASLSSVIMMALTSSVSVGRSTTPLIALPSAVRSMTILGRRSVTSSFTSAGSDRNVTTSDASMSTTALPIGPPGVLGRPPPSVAVELAPGTRLQATISRAPTSFGTTTRCGCPTKTPTPMVPLM